MAENTDISVCVNGLERNYLFDVCSGRLYLFVMDSTTSLGDRLVWARSRRKLTQAALAALVGMTQQGIADIENGRSKNPASIASLAWELGVNAYWLETGQGNWDDSEGRLTAEERLMLDTMRAMKPTKRAALLEFVIGTFK